MFENDDSQGLTQYLDQNREWKQFQLVTTREMQLTLKMVMNKITVQNFDQRLGIIGYDGKQISKFRDQCKNVKLRHIYLRLVSRDFYTKERMLQCTVAQMAAR